MKNYENDLDDIPDEVLDTLEIIGVTHIDEVLRVALT
jgi:ATP-dependent Lon protease